MQAGMIKDSTFFAKNLLGRPMKFLLLHDFSPQPLYGRNSRREDPNGRSDAIVANVGGIHHPAADRRLMQLVRHAV
jgi:hypothetical protein